MRNKIIVLALFTTMIAVGTLWAWTKITVRSEKACYKASSGHIYDTSNAYDLRYANHAETFIYCPNVDSTTFYTYVDGKFAGQWVNVYTFTHIIDKGGKLDSTWTENFDNAWSIPLRTDTADFIKGANIIRFRNKVGAATSATYGQVYYNQELILRK